MSNSKLTRRSRRSAFTLIEVLIVLVIVLAIGGIVAVNLLPRREQAVQDTVQIQIGQFESALEQFYFDFSRYPTEDEGLAVLWDKSLLEDEQEQEKHPGNYFEKNKKIPEDYWGNEWGYTLEEDEDGKEMYRIWSNGKDGEEDTDDDIKSWDDEDDEDFGGGVGG